MKGTCTHIGLVGASHYPTTSLPPTAPTPTPLNPICVHVYLSLPHYPTTSYRPYPYTPTPLNPMCTCIPLTTPLPHYPTTSYHPYPYTPQTHMCTCIPLTTTLPPTAHPTPLNPICVDACSYLSLPHYLTTLVAVNHAVMDHAMCTWIRHYT